MISIVKSFQNFLSRRCFAINLVFLLVSPFMSSGKVKKEEKSKFEASLKKVFGISLYKHQDGKHTSDP